MSPPPDATYGPETTPGPEWPAIRALLPADRDLVGADVVDLGCGEGTFCRWVLDRGAGSVLGLDLSESSVDRARTASGLDAVDPDAPEGPLHFELSDLDQVTLRYASYDLAHCALVLQHLQDPLRLFRVVHAGLRPGGRLLLTFPHPILTAPATREFATVGGRRVWPLDRYAEEGPRGPVYPVLSPGVGPDAHHRTLGTVLTALGRAGLMLRELVEWVPSAEQVVAHPTWADDRDRPRLVILAADRPRPGTVPR